MTATLDDAEADLRRTIAELEEKLRERTAERDEAVDQQIATSEVLQVINASPGDLAPVFDAMLEKAIRLCEATIGVLWVRDGEGFGAAALRGVPPAFEERVRASVKPHPETGLGRILSGESLVINFELQTGIGPTGVAPERALAGLEEGCWSIEIALRKEEILFGALTVYRREVRPFSDKQVALVKNFAAQAVIAIENARLITETREALEQQTATAEVLGVINSSPGDVAPVFDAMLGKALHLCEASVGNLITFDGEYFHFGAGRGPTEFNEWVRRHGPMQPAPGTTMARMRAGEEVVHIIDIADDDAYRAGNPVRRALVEIGGFRTFLGVALRRDDMLLGALQVYRQQVRPFSDKQIALLQNFAAQAVIAMENARLITETREALEQQTATAEVLQVINSSPGDLTPVFDAMLEKALHFCQAAFGALWSSEGGNLEVTAVRGVPPEYEQFLRTGPHQPTLFQQRLLRGRPFEQIADVTLTDGYRAGLPLSRALADLGGVRTLLAVALRKDDKVLGIFGVYRQEVRLFSDRQIALLQNFAAQAVIAMENARLLNELRASTDEIAGWNKELETRVAAQLAEIERTGKLRRFLAPQLADLIVAQGDDRILESHRREIVVVFCDLRGFTGFAERAEPEEVMALLKDYHAAMGPIVASFEGTLDHYAGDGIMVFFNDPVPTPDPARRAIEMAVAMRAAAQALLRSWRRHGHDIGFGVGISQGYATLGQIGFAERMDYTAIGTVTNLAARLCAEAKDGQILVSRRVAIAVEDSAQLEEVGDLSLKGLSQAVAVYNVPQ